MFPSHESWIAYRCHVFSWRCQIFPLRELRIPSLKSWIPYRCHVFPWRYQMFPWRELRIPSLKSLIPYRCHVFPWRYQIFPWRELRIPSHKSWIPYRYHVFPWRYQFPTWITWVTMSNFFLRESCDLRSLIDISLQEWCVWVGPKTNLAGDTGKGKRNSVPTLATKPL